MRIYIHTCIHIYIYYGTEPDRVSLLFHALLSSHMVTRHDALQITLSASLAGLVVEVIAVTADLAASAIQTCGLFGRRSQHCLFLRI